MNMNHFWAGVFFYLNEIVTNLRFSNVLPVVSLLALVVVVFQVLLHTQLTRNGKEVAEISLLY